MITNAAILRIDRRTGASITGEPILAQGTAVAIRCSLQRVTSTQRMTLGATIKDAESVAYVPAGGLSAAGEAALATGDRVRIQMDAGAGLTPPLFVGEVVRPSTWIKATLSHQELFLQAV